MFEDPHVREDVRVTSRLHAHRAEGILRFFRLTPALVKRGLQPWRLRCQPGSRVRIEAGTAEHVTVLAEENEVLREVLGDAASRLVV